MRSLLFLILSLFMSLTAHAAPLDRQGLERAFSEKLQANVEILSIKLSNDPIDWVTDFYDDVQTRQVVLLIDSQDKATCKLVRNEIYNSFYLESCRATRFISDRAIYIAPL